MTLSIEKLGEMVVEYRDSRALGIRAAAKQIGISSATLSRIENGNVPDLATFASICKWLGTDPNLFLGMQPTSTTDHPPTVHLRKQKTTNLDTATALGGLIIAAQTAMRDIENL